MGVKVSPVAAADVATIVVVEQSAAVQELIDQALRDSGDYVLITQNPLEVLEVARRVQIDLLVLEFSDAGPSLVDEVRSIQPGMHVLYLTEEDDDDPPPFALDDFRARVDETLER
jgi:DNA-binding response OmpR family regulator